MIGSKWPLLLVVGEQITEERADEILVRTDHWHISVNDRSWQRDVCAMAGIAQSEYGCGDWRSTQAFREKVHALDLHYLHNSRIASSWIGGPHGWCDWAGRIGTTNYNIGKWPSTEGVTEDWQAIAAAFPFLDLTAQVIEDEGEGPLAGQWRVRAGAVEYEDAPTERIAHGTDPFFFSVLVPGGERGVSPRRLQRALDRVLAKEVGA